MNPTISDFIESFCNPTHCLNRLRGIVPETPESIPFISGGNSVIFKVRNNGQEIAAKCYFRQRKERREHYRRYAEFFSAAAPTFLVPYHLLTDEVTIYGMDGETNVLDVLQGEWVKGETLGTSIRRNAFLGDGEQLTLLTEKFLQFSLQLLQSDFCHGDLKPENIILSDEDKFTLIDYDACYTPFHKELANNEVGTTWFQHPDRKASDYGPQTDNYAIAMIAVSLIALSEQPELLGTYSNGSNLLFVPAEITEKRSRLYGELTEKWSVSSDRSALLRFLGQHDIATGHLTAVLESLLNPQREIDTQRLSFIDTDTCEGLKRVCNEYSLIGYADQQNRLVIDPIYSDASVFRGGIAAVRSHRKSFFIDPKGTRLSADYDDIAFVGQGYAVAAIDKKYGYLDTHTFRFSIHPVFDYAYGYFCSAARVKIGEKYRYIDKMGDFLFDETFDYASDFREDYAIVRNGDLYGVLNTQGDYLLLPQPIRLLFLKDGVLYYEHDTETQKTDLSEVIKNKKINFV